MTDIQEENDDLLIDNPDQEETTENQEKPEAEEDKEEKQVENEDDDVLGLENEDDQEENAGNSNNGTTLAEDMENNEEKDDKKEVKYIRIKNLSRPFSLVLLKKRLQEEVGTNSDMDNFWIDSIKSKCFFNFSDNKDFESNSKKLIDGLHQTTWPESNPKKLLVEVVDQQELEDSQYYDEYGKWPRKNNKEGSKEIKSEAGSIKREDARETIRARVDSHISRDSKRSSQDRDRDFKRESNNSPAPATKTSHSYASNRPRFGDFNGKFEKEKIDPKEIFYPGKNQKPMGRENNNQNSRRERSPCPEPPAMEDNEALESRFRFTKTQPRIYWRACTDDEIEKKRAKKETSSKNNDVDMKEEDGDQLRKYSDNSDQSSDSGRSRSASPVKPEPVEEEQKQKEGLYADLN